MTFGPSLYYLVATLLVLAAARWRGGVSLDCAVVLLVWLALVNLTYQKGVVETTETMTIAALFIVLCVLLIRKWDQHWLPIYLLFSGFAMVLWTAFWHGDAYLYKAVKNGIYIGELGAVGVSVWTTRKRSAT